MRRLGEDIQHFARRHGLRQGIEAAAVIKAARSVLPQILPEVLHDDVHIEAYRDSTLFITAPTGSSIATVHHYRKPLLNALKTKLGRAVVARLVVRPRLGDTNTERVLPD